MKSVVKHNFKKVTFCKVHRDECRSVKKKNKCDGCCETCGNSEEVQQYRQL